MDSHEVNNPWTTSYNRDTDGLGIILNSATKLQISIPSEPKTVNNESVKLIQLLEEGDQLESTLIKVIDNLSIHLSSSQLKIEYDKLQQELDSIDVSNVDTLQSRSMVLMKLCSSLKEFCDNKNRILSRLQQPFTSDGLHIGSDYKLHFVTLMNEIIKSLCALSEQVQLIQWSKTPNIDISKMVKKM